MIIKVWMKWAETEFWSLVRSSKAPCCSVFTSFSLSYCKLACSWTQRTKQKTQESSCWLYMHTLPPAHSLCTSYSHTLYYFTKRALQHEHVNVLAVVPLTAESSFLLNPNSPGTERIISQALTAVMLWHCYFNNFSLIPLAHPPCTSLSSAFSLS